MVCNCGSSEQTRPKCLARKLGGCCCISSCTASGQQSCIIHSVELHEQYQDNWKSLYPQERSTSSTIRSSFAHSCTFQCLRSLQRNRQQQQERAEGGQRLQQHRAPYYLLRPCTIHSTKYLFFFFFLFVADAVFAVYYMNSYDDGFVFLCTTVEEKQKRKGPVNNLMAECLCVGGYFFVVSLSLSDGDGH